MKNKTIKLISLLGIIAIVYYFTSNAGYCAIDFAQLLANKTPMQNTLIKFGFVMGGVLISALVIFGGLSVYNKVFAKHVTKKSASGDDISAQSPKTLNDAIIFFINKNKMK